MNIVFLILCFESWLNLTQCSNLSKALAFDNPIGNWQLYFYVNFEQDFLYFLEIGTERIFLLKGFPDG